MKIIYLISCLIFLMCFSFAQTITTKAPIQTSLCAGGNIIVEYETSGSFNFSTTFTAQLSDEWGNFNNPRYLGSTPINLGYIFGTIPNDVSFGLNYRVRVISDNPQVIGSTSPFPPIVITSSAVSAYIVANPGTEICQGDSISLWVGYNEEYFWSTGATSQSIYVKNSGTYTVTVTNYLTGCQVTADPINITVHPLPEVDLGGNRELCVGDTLILDAGSGYNSYNWNSGMANTQTITVTSTGKFRVRVIDSNGCRNFDTAMVAFYFNPEVDLGNDTVLCANSFLINADVSGLSISTFKWNNGLSFNQNLEVTQSGQYFIVVTNEKNCKAYDTINVTLFNPPFINLGNDISVCGGGVVLNAGNNYQYYDWNDGASLNQLLPVYTTGNYYVVVTDANGCTGTDSVNVYINSLPNIDLGQNITINLTDVLILDAGQGYISYLWSTGETTASITIDAANYLPGDYTFSVTVIDSNYCVNSDMIVVSIVEETSSVYSYLEKLIIYPIPVNDYLIIEGIDFGTNIIKPVLVSVTGNELFPNYSFAINKLLISRNNIAPGLYYLILEIEGQRYTTKRIIFE